MRAILTYVRPNGTRGEWQFLTGPNRATYAINPPVTEGPDPVADAESAAAEFRARGFSEVAVFDEDGALTIPTTKETK